MPFPRVVIARSLTAVDAAPRVGEVMGGLRSTLISVGLFVGAGSTSGAVLSAHDGLHERIDRASRQIAARPDEPGLYLLRGELRRQHGDPFAALRDLRRAEGLGCDRRRLTSVRAKSYLDAGWTSVAELHLRRHLAADAGDGNAQWLLVRSLGERGVHEEALERLDALLGVPGQEPDPDRLLYRARLQVAVDGGEVIRALAGLDRAMEELGVVPSLQVRAIQFERQRGAFDRALARLEALAAFSRRRESFALRRGEILLEAGREREAREAFLESRQALERLDESRRATRSAREISERVERHLKQLGVDR